MRVIESVTDETKVLTNGVTQDDDAMPARKEPVDDDAVLRQLERMTELFERRFDDLRAPEKPHWVTKHASLLTLAAAVIFGAGGLFIKSNADERYFMLQLALRDERIERTEKDKQDLLQMLNRQQGEIARADSAATDSTFAVQQLRVEIARATGRKLPIPRIDDKQK